jgi:hypothetical protein
MLVDAFKLMPTELSPTAVVSLAWTVRSRRVTLVTPFPTMARAPEPTTVLKLAGSRIHVLGLYAPAISMFDRSVRLWA